MTFQHLRTRDVIFQSTGIKKAINTESWLFSGLVQLRTAKNFSFHCAWVCQMLSEAKWQRDPIIKDIVTCKADRENEEKSWGRVIELN